MNKISLLKFIAKAHKNTYAAPQEVKLRNKCKTPILDGHIDYDFVEGDWRYSNCELFSNVCSQLLIVNVF